jgi:hypothetical protein
LNGHLLRETVSFPLLNRPGQSNEIVKELHEAQTTIALTGIDQGRWTAVALIDSTQISASFTDYDPEAVPDGVQAEDLITGKHLSANTRTMDPRLYFLWAWESWVEKVLTDWNRILAHVKQTAKW